jgi:pimeloyl-ACP methyl ester carboxylesterase
MLQRYGAPFSSNRNGVFVLSVRLMPLRVKVPALLILGKNDRFAVEAMASEGLHYCDDKHLETFETATHWVQHEVPAQVNTLLSQFFA